MRLMPGLGLLGDATPPRVGVRFVWRLAALFRPVFLAEARLALPRLVVRLLVFRVGDTGGVVGSGVGPRRSIVARTLIGSNLSCSAPSSTLNFVTLYAFCTVRR